MEVVPNLRHVDHLRLVGVGGGLQERRHVGVGAAEAVLDVVIPLGQAPSFFTTRTAGSRGCQWVFQSARISAAV